MHAFALAHWWVLIIAWIFWIIPLYRLLGRVGLGQGWAFVTLFPPAGMVLLWVIAFSRWPSHKG